MNTQEETAWVKISSQSLLQTDAPQTEGQVTFDGFNLKLSTHLKHTDKPSLSDRWGTGDKGKRSLWITELQSDYWPVPA